MLPLEIDDLMESYEFKQAMIYFDNKKYEKSLKQLSELKVMMRLIEFGKPCYLMILKNLYNCNIRLGRLKDGEMILKNILEIS